MDFIVAMITDNHDEKPVMSAHNAASWGYFDTVANKVKLGYLLINHVPLLEYFCQLYVTFRISKNVFFS